MVKGTDKVDDDFKRVIERFEEKDKYIDQCRNKIIELEESIREELVKERNKIENIKSQKTEYLIKLINDYGINVFYNKDISKKLYEMWYNDCIGNSEIDTVVSKTLNDTLNFKLLFEFRGYKGTYELGDIVKTMCVSISKEDKLDDILKNSEVCDKIFNTQLGINKDLYINISEDTLSEYGIYRIIKLEDNRYAIDRYSFGNNIVKEFDTMEEVFEYILKKLTYN